MTGRDGVGGWAGGVDCAALCAVSSIPYNATQRMRFLRNEKELRTFYATADAATALVAPCGAPQANRNDFCFSATSEAKSTNQIRAAFTFNQ